MVYTKWMLAPAFPEDGMRISVMNRHTHPDGVTSDARIAQVHFHHHLPIFGPSARLLGDYYKRDLPWEEFCNRYYAEMLVPEKMVYVHRLAILGKHQDITLLCIEQNPCFCHRQLLTCLMRREFPELEVEHRW